MDATERVVSNFLKGLGYDPVYEPDGNVPPDFLVNGSIAVEARRLNHNELTSDGHRGLEETAVPLRFNLKRLLRDLGPPRGNTSWRVFYQFKRPLPPWSELDRCLRRALETFRNEHYQEPACLGIGQNFRI